VIVDVERVAHGGSCVGRAPDGRVVFVRHALPGERVRVDVTAERRNYLRGDAVEVLLPSPDRVEPPCPYAGPGRCGGCDWQHVALARQRALKGDVIAEQLQRLGRLQRTVRVEAVEPADGLGWRGRLRLAVDDSGRAGLRRHRSHDVEPIGDCLIATAAIDVPAVVDREWPPGAEVNVEATATGDRAVSIGTPDDEVTEFAAGRAWAVPVGGFWQAHVRAADVLAGTVVDVAGVTPDAAVLDLYSGVGLFAGVLSPLARSVTAVESDPRAVTAARRNLPDVNVVEGDVGRWLQRQDSSYDVVVLDPPRRGAGRQVAEAIAALRPRTVVYVACDPAAFARDVATFGGLGYPLAELRAFDLFPMTAHVECVGVFRP
jgi:tRNA/tmRNA/rRNA uracil-C5-methylase (TrmA/RlmC/RlmD family)